MKFEHVTRRNQSFRGENMTVALRFAHSFKQSSKGFHCYGDPTGLFRVCELFRMETMDEKRNELMPAEIAGIGREDFAVLHVGAECAAEYAALCLDADFGQTSLSVCFFGGNRIKLDDIQRRQWIGLRFGCHED